MRLHRVLLPLALSALASCAAIPQGQSERDVQQLLTPRLQHTLDWSGADAKPAPLPPPLAQLLNDQLSLAEALRIALVNNRSLRARFAALGVAEAELLQAGLGANPVIEVARRKSDEGHERELNVVQDLLDLITIAPRQRVQAAALEQAKFETAHATLELAHQVKRAYYALAGDMQAYELFRTAVEATQAAAELADRQVQAGTLNRLQQSLHQALYAQELLELARTQARIKTERESFNRLLGLWGADTRWQIAARLPELPATLPALETVESAAIGARFDLAAARKRAQATASALGFTRDYRFLAALGIGFSVTRETSGERIKGPHVELGLPLFDRGQARSARLQAQLREDEERLAALAVDIRSEVREARDRLSATQEQAVYLRDVLLPLREQIAQETLLRYNGMLAGVYELLSAKQEQIAAARDYIHALREFWFAWADLEHSSGAALPMRAPDSAPQPNATPPSAPQPDPAADHQHHQQ